MKRAWVTFPVLAVQILTILAAQLLWSVCDRSLFTVPHAALDECAQHRCDCDPELMKQKACCCFPTPDAPAEGHADSAPPGVLPQLLATDQCGGTTHTHAGAIWNPEVVLPSPATIPARHPRMVWASDRAVAILFPRCEPPDPPPRAFPLV